MKRFTLTVHSPVPALGLEEGDTITVDPTNLAQPFVLHRILPGEFWRNCMEIRRCDTGLPAGTGQRMRRIGH